MNNKHLSWYEEINNNFIIASRAYFLHFDGAFSLQGGGAGVLLVAPTGERLKYDI